MSVVFGYSLKDCIISDEKIKEYINESYDLANEKYSKEDVKYKLNDINISAIFINVDTVGEIYHGIEITVPKTIQIDKFKNQLHKLINQKLNHSVYIWEETTDLEYNIHIECEDIIINIIEDKYNDSKNRNNELYTLLKDR